MELDFVASHGVAFLDYHDLRHSTDARKKLSTALAAEGSVEVERRRPPRPR
jgi:hypothetical protein